VTNELDKISFSNYESCPTVELALMEQRRMEYKQEERLQSGSNTFTFYSEPPKKLANTEHDKFVTVAKEPLDQ